MSVTFSGPALAGALVLAMAGTSFGQITGPANLPPAGFTGQQFIDNRGCVFVRAGFGGQVNWVARVDARHRPICTGPAAAVEMAETAPVAAVAVPVMTAPPSGADAPTIMTQPVAAARPARQGGGLFAFLFAPRAVAVPLPVPVVVAPPMEVAVTFSNPVRRELPRPPSGWQYAWKDGRLNPMRGVGTAQGQAQQNQVYSQTVPLVALADLSPKERAKVEKRAARLAAQSAVTVATMSAPAPRVTVATMSAPEANGGAMIQVGCFGQPANAEAAGARIAGLGLPVATAQTKGLQVVMAGPFAPGDAAAALQALKAAGFKDAFLR